MDWIPIKPIFLLGTGANGVNHHLSIIKAISQTGIDCQILALCGRNEQTFQAINRLSISNPRKVLPFRRLEANAMVDLLNVSTWMLARPGAGLTTEAVVTGCPIIFDLSGGCMPQETNNLNFLEGESWTFTDIFFTGQLIQNIQSGLDVPRLFIPMENSPNLSIEKINRTCGEIIKVSSKANIPVWLLLNPSMHVEACFLVIFCPTFTSSNFLPMMKFPLEVSCILKRNNFAD